jgi:hypothetical protein
VTDLDQTLDMLARAKIDFERRLVGVLAAAHPNEANTVNRHAGFTVLTVELGYHGFVSELIFDATGASSRSKRSNKSVRH